MEAAARLESALRAKVALGGAVASAYTLRGRGTALSMDGTGTLFVSLESSERSLSLSFAFASRSHRMKNFINTALPRVGVARPNGSYVARTQVLAARATLVRRRTLADARRAYRTSTPRTRVTEGEIPGGLSCRLLVRRSEIFDRAFKRTGDLFLDVSASRRRSSVRDKRLHAAIIWENEN